MPRRHRNIVFKLALVVMSLALASVGVFGWADAANAFEAFQSHSWAGLDSLWPLYAAAAIGCLAAQVIAACSTVNFARLTSAPPVWRFLAGCFYAAAVVFAAYSADRGAQVVLTSAHRSAYETRETERHTLSAEITAINGRLALAGQRLGFDPATTMTARQNSALATYNALTRIDRDRLPLAQGELASRPPLPREIALDFVTALAVFAIFLAWAILEPWGYALAERGREANIAPARRPFEVVEGGLPAHRPPATARHWAGRSFLAGLATWWALQSQSAQAVSAPPGAPESPPNPVERMGDLVSETDLKAAAEKLASHGVGERQIAAQLSTRYNHFVSRWQVRKMLGRVAA